MPQKDQILRQHREGFSCRRSRCRVLLFRVCLSIIVKLMDLIATSTILTQQQEGKNTAEVSGWQRSSATKSSFTD